MWLSSVHFYVKIRGINAAGQMLTLTVVCGIQVDLKSCFNKGCKRLHFTVSVKKIIS